MKRFLPSILLYLSCVICLALFLTGGVMLSAYLNHEHITERTEAVQATCTHTGNIEYWRCTVCNKYFSDELATQEIPLNDTVIAQLPHDEEIIEGKPATCTETGLSDGKRCTVCDSVTVPQTVIETLPHAEEIIQGKLPTCTETGISNGKRCTVCDTVTVPQKVMDMLPHVEEIISGTPATCTQSGISDGKRCTVCNNVTLQQTVIDALGHNPQFIEETASTCSAHGNPDYWHCGRCNGSFAEQACSTALTADDIVYPLADHPYKQCFTSTRHYKVATCEHELEQTDVGTHNFVSKVCSDCGFHDYGVKYALSPYGNAYSVTGRDTYGYDRDIEIYREYDGLPVTEIARNAFSNDTITSIILPKGIIKIDEYAFWACKSLSSINIPSTVSTIKDRAFAYCSNLEAITVDKDNLYYSGNGNCVVGKRTQQLIIGCSGTVIPTDNTVTAIANHAFYCNEKLTAISIPASVTEIGELAFYGCVNLSELSLSQNLVSIGYDAFCDCKALTKLHIPENVNYIGSQAFLRCIGLEEITVDSDNNDYYAEGNCLVYRMFSANQLILGCKNSVIPSGVTYIGSSAFYDCPITEIAIPDSVNYISNAAFYGCSQLTKLHIPKNVTDIADNAFSGLWSATEITVDPANTKYFAVNNCLIERSTSKLITGCGNSEIPQDGTVTSIYSSAFEGTSIESIVIPSGIQQDYVPYFTGCTNLKEITILASIERLPHTAFSGCTSLTSVTLPPTITGIGFYAFKDCTALTDLTLPASVTHIDDNAFEGTDIQNLYLEDLESWLNIELPSHTSTAYPFRASPIQKGGNVYLGGELITEVVIPEGITKVRHYAFDNWLSLNKLVISDEVTEYNSDALYGCKNVTELIIGDGVTEMPYIHNLNKLKTLVLGDGITEIGTNDCRNFTELTDVTFGNNITEIGTGAFSGCTGLTEIVLPESLQVIGSGSFIACSNLTTVTIYGNVTKIASNAFRNCTSLTDIYFDGTKEKWLELAMKGWDNNTGEYTIHFNDDTTMTKGEE